MYFCWISILFAIINFWCYKQPPETLPPLWMGKVINFSWLRVSLGLQNTGVKLFFIFLNKRLLMLIFSELRFSPKTEARLAGIR